MYASKVVPMMSQSGCSCQNHLCCVWYANEVKLKCLLGAALKMESLGGQSLSNSFCLGKLIECSNRVTVIRAIGWCDLLWWLHWSSSLVLVPPYLSLLKICLLSPSWLCSVPLILNIINFMMHDGSMLYIREKNYCFYLSMIRDVINNYLSQSLKHCVFIMIWAMTSLILLRP